MLRTIDFRFFADEVIAKLPLNRQNVASEGEERKRSVVTTLSLSDDTIAPRREGGRDESFAIPSNDRFNHWFMILSMKRYIFLLMLLGAWMSFGETPQEAIRRCERYRDIFGREKIHQKLVNYPDGWQHLSRKQQKKYIEKGNLRGYPVCWSFQAFTSGEYVLATLDCGNVTYMLVDSNVRPFGQKLTDGHPHIDYPDDFFPMEFLEQKDELARRIPNAKSSMSNRKNSAKNRNGLISNNYRDRIIYCLVVGRCGSIPLQEFYASMVKLLTEKQRYLEKQRKVTKIEYTDKDKPLNTDKSGKSNRERKRNTTNPNSDNKYDSKSTKGAHNSSLKTDGQLRTAGLRPEGLQSAGGRSEGFRSEGLRSEGFRPEGFRPEGFRSEGLRSEGFRPEGFRTDGVRTDGVRTDVPLQTDTSHTDDVLENDGTLILEMGLDTSITFYLENGALQVRKGFSFGGIGTHHDLQTQWPKLYFGKPICLAGGKKWELTNPLFLSSRPLSISNVVLLSSGRRDVPINNQQHRTLCGITWNSSSISLYDHAFSSSMYKIKIYFDTSQ
ncbi:MAG: hypothetical protein IJJ26_09975 [Victivallales bacterium]|nr:hypothetical protein [Victivallales bacterium]